MKQDLFQAIADHTRWAILTLITVQAFTPDALAARFDRSRQAVSKQNMLAEFRKLYEILFNQLNNVLSTIKKSHLG